MASESFHHHPVSASTVEREQINRHLDAWLTEYESQGKPIAISFRDLLPKLNYFDRATHALHPYPARLLKHIPHFFLNSELVRSDEGAVLDPFCGSGTVLLEAILAGRAAFGADTNPLARLITSVKLRPLDANLIQKAVSQIEIESKKPRHREAVPRRGLDYWYLPEHLQELDALLSSILAIDDVEIGDFLKVCFSVTARAMSLADPRISVPVRIPPPPHDGASHMAQFARSRYEWLSKAEVATYFSRVCLQNSERLRQLGSVLQEYQSCNLETDVRNVNRKDWPLFRTIITSPPYLGAQKYVRASSLSLAWLGYANDESLRAVERTSIGREFAARHEYVAPGPPTGLIEADNLIAEVRERNALRAHLASTYLLEMRDALTECVAALQPGGNLILVAGSNSVTGLEFPTHRFLKQLAQSLGLSLRLELSDTIRSRGLLTKRNGGAPAMSQEVVMVLDKLDASTDGRDA